MTSFWVNKLRVGTFMFGLFINFVVQETDSQPDKADHSLAVLVSTRNTIDGLTAFAVMYGDPEVYLNEAIEGRRNNLSRLDNIWKRNEISLYSAGALEVDYNQSIVFWSGEASGFIQKYPKLLYGNNGTSDDLTYAAVSGKVSGLALDWVSNLLYWSDVGYQRIGAVHLINGAWRAVADTDLTSPQDVVVYPQLSYVFWSDAGANPKIERMNMARNTRLIIVSSPMVQGPKTLAIDFNNQRLFWLDIGKGQIGSSNFDGAQVSSFPLSQHNGAEISGFFLYKEYIVYAEKTRFRIEFYNISERVSGVDIIRNDLLGISDAIMYEPTRQPIVTSPCNNGNGRCEYICFTVNANTRRCACDMGWFVASDGTSCVTQPFSNNFLFVTDPEQEAIYQVNLGTGEVRGVLYTYIGESPIAYNPNTNTFYWSDERNERIYRSTVNYPRPTIYAEETGSSVTSLAFDPIRQALYYVDYDQNAIQQISKTPDSQIRSTYFSADGYRPMVIRLDVADRLMYWTDCGYLSIEVATLNDSSNHRTVVSTPSGCATALDVDSRGEILYWADEVGNIWQANFDGSRITKIFNDSSASISGVALDSKYLYIADSNKRFVQRIDRGTHEVSNLTKILFTRPYSVLSYYTVNKTTEATSRPTVTTTVTTSATTTMTTIVGLTDGFHNSNDSDNKTTIIVATVVTVVGVLILVIVTIVVITKCRQNETDKNPSLNDAPSRYETSMDNFYSQHVYDMIDPDYLTPSSVTSFQDAPPMKEL